MHGTNNKKNVLKGNLEESAEEKCNFGTFINTETNLRVPQKQFLLEQLRKFLSEELNCRPTMTIVWLMIYILLSLTELSDATGADP
jgi:hypothetical protein